jgi:hypothetical protein
MNQPQKYPTNIVQSAHSVISVTNTTSQLQAILEKSLLGEELSVEDACILFASQGDDAQAVVNLRSLRGMGVLLEVAGEIGEVRTGIVEVGLICVD